MMIAHRRILCITGLALALTGGGGGSSARGGTVSFSNSVPVATTNWSLSFSLPMFDSSLGTLTSVALSVNTSLAASFKFESLNNGPSTITFNAAYAMQTQRPDLSILLTGTGNISTSDAVSTFDGTIDFGGTSGKDYPSLTGIALASNTFSSAPDLALFTGTGNIALPVSVTAAANSTGPGNIVRNWTTQASATAEITYTYTAIPAPAAASLMACGLGLIAFRRRRNVG